ncbi:MAG: alpha/beta hydrolase [Acidobacteriota bacterium]
MSREVKVNGVRLNFVVEGAGAPLYLLHGGMESRKSFERQIPAFAQHFTVVALDSREQGQSGPSDEPVSYELMARDVFALAEHLGHERISIVGSSDGAITALTLAMQSPELIERLVLLGASFHVDAYPDGMREFLRDYEWDGSTEPTGYPGVFLEHYLTGHENLDGFGALLTKMAALWTSSPTYSKADLLKVEAPVLVINGDREDTALWHVLELYEGLPDARLFVVPEGTHYVLQEQPELVNDVALAFLAPPLERDGAGTRTE